MMAAPPLGKMMSFCKQRLQCLNSVSFAWHTLLQAWHTKLESRIQFYHCSASCVVFSALAFAFTFSRRSCLLLEREKRTVVKKPKKKRKYNTNIVFIYNEVIYIYKYFSTVVTFFQNRTTFSNRFLNKSSFKQQMYSL